MDNTSPIASAPACNTPTSLNLKYNWVICVKFDIELIIDSIPSDLMLVRDKSKDKFVRFYNLGISIAIDYAPILLVSLKYSS